LERKFFKAANDLDTYAAAKEAFLLRINQISEKWIDNKFRLRILGLEDK